VAFKVLAERDDVQKVVWVNADGESGLPYDITLFLNDDLAQKVFVEVKTTSQRPQFGHTHMNACHISLEELNFALVKGNSYWVCRVLGALSEDVKIVVFKDLASRLLRSQAQLLVDLPFESL